MPIPLNNDPLDERWIFEPVQPKRDAFAYQGMRPKSYGTGRYLIRDEGHTEEKALEYIKYKAREIDIQELIDHHNGVDK